MKSPKSAVDYREPNEERPGSQHCGSCSMFRPPTACASVAGYIDPGAWCRLWEARRTREIAEALRR